jgi:putative ABC transport system ATP-binding protein
MRKNMDLMIRLEDLWKCYDDRSDHGTEALRGLDLSIPRGETVALFGRSGSGKSTLFHLIAGLDRPTRGRIFVDGHDIGQIGEEGRTRIRRERLGFVFQSFNLIPTLSVLENVQLPLQMLGKDRDAAGAALDGVGLSEKGKRFPHELSGGEQQRVAIARAIVKEPVLILADEPTGNLDTETGDLVLAILSDLCGRLKATLLMATHSQRASRIAGRVLTMEDGRIVRDSVDAGSP